MVSAPTEIRELPYRDVLREPFAGRFFTGQLISGFGDSLIPVALAFAVLRLSGSVEVLGVALALRGLPALFASMIGGVAGDFISPRKLVVASALSGGLLNAAAAIGMWTLPPHAAVAVLIATTMLAALVSAYAGPPSGRYVRAVFPDQSALLSAAGLQRTLKSVVQVGAYALSGLVVAFGSPSWAFVLNAGTFFVAAITLIMIPRDLPSVKRTESQATRMVGFWGNLVDGWRIVLSQKSFALTTFASFLATLFIIQPYLTVGPDVVRIAYGPSSAMAWGFLGALFGAGGIVAGAIARPLKPKHPLIASTALTLVDLPLLVVLALAPTSWLLFPLSFVSGAQSVLGGIWSTQALYSSFAESVTSRVASVTSWAWLVPAFLGPLLVAAIGGAVDERLILILGSAMLGLACVILLPIQLRIERRSREWI